MSTPVKKTTKTLKKPNPKVRKVSNSKIKTTLKIDIYNQQGKVVGQEKLDAKIFGVEPKEELINQTVVLILGNLRHPFAHTKTRSDVRGGGKKPWKQKGTGRARAGTIRSPLWRGGGITFGPSKLRNYTRKINKKVKRKVLLMCLTDKVQSKRICVLDKLEMPEIKTKNLYSIINTLTNLSDTSATKKTKKVLLSLPEKDLNVIKSAQNIKGTKTIRVIDLNILDLIKSDYFLTTVEGIKKLEKHFK